MVAQQPPGLRLIGIEFQHVLQNRLSLRRKIVLEAPVGQHHLADGRVGRLLPLLLEFGQFGPDGLDLLDDVGLQRDLPSAGQCNDVRLPWILVRICQVAFNAAAAAEREGIGQCRLKKTEDQNARPRGAESLHDNRLFQNQTADSKSPLILVYTAQG